MFVSPYYTVSDSTLTLPSHYLYYGDILAIQELTDNWKKKKRGTESKESILERREEKKKKQPTFLKGKVSYSIMCRLERTGTRGNE